MQTVEKPMKGAWNNMQAGGAKRKEKITWKDSGDSQVVTFLDDNPFEYIKEDNTVLYIFNVTHEGEQKVILTSAWSMLKGLKAFAPLKDKILKITKVIEVGKQRYDVADLAHAKEEAIVA